MSLLLFTKPIFLEEIFFHDGEPHKRSPKTTPFISRQVSKLINRERKEVGEKPLRFVDIFTLFQVSAKKAEEIHRKELHRLKAQQEARKREDEEIATLLMLDLI